MELTLILTLVFVATALLIHTLVTGVGKRVSSYEDDYLKRKRMLLNQLYVYLPPERLYAFKMLCAFLVAATTWLYTRELPGLFALALIPLAALLGLFIPDGILHLLIQKRRKKFNRQMNDVMNSITNGLRSGFSFMQAMNMLGERLPDPAGQEFRTTMHEVSLGVSVADALVNMDKRLGDEDLRTMIVATRLTMQTGGDLPNVYHQLTEMIRERNRVEGKINALTAQGKMQATVVAMIPPAMFLIVRAVNPQIMDYLFKTVEGWFIVGGVVLLDIIGFVWMRRVIAIKF